MKGETQDRDRYFLGFNTPYRPEILISTSVGQEGIDLHRECRHVIHHDLCWNPATIEQRTGRVDRIGSKVERERMDVPDGQGPTLEIAVPYLAATYDERMFEELYRRAQLFEVTLGGEMRVEGRIDSERVVLESKSREKQGIGTDDEDIGVESEEAGMVDPPNDMVECCESTCQSGSLNRCYCAIQNNCGIGSRLGENNPKRMQPASCGRNHSQSNDVVVAATDALDRDAVKRSQATAQHG